MLAALTLMSFDCMMTMYTVLKWCRQRSSIAVLPIFDHSLVLGSRDARNLELGWIGQLFVGHRVETHRSCGLPRVTDFSYSQYSGQLNQNGKRADIMEFCLLIKSTEEFELVGWYRY